MAQQNANPHNPVGWFEIYVDDIDRARKFYETVLDTKMQDLPSPGQNEIKMATFPMKPEAPNAGGSLVKMDGMRAGGNSTIVYFSSADCAIEEGKVENAGGKIFKKKCLLANMVLCHCVQIRKATCLAFIPINSAKMISTD